jgi:Asp-tRNA(Asn)/Glu-tRNA(Gln) amidotransferase A subunit family amidase
MRWRRDEAIAILGHGWRLRCDRHASRARLGTAELTQTGDPLCCTLWSLLGFPAISIPAGMAPNGLPLGLQIAATPGADDRLLAVARWCAERIRFQGLA